MAELIGIDAVVAEACTIIKGVTEQEKVLMRQWSYRGMLKVGFSSLDIKVSDPITISDWSFEKPSALASTIDLAVLDSTGAEIVTIFKGRGEVDTNQSLSRVHEDVRQRKLAIQVTEDNGYFNIEEFTDTSPTAITMVVKYYAYPVDENGMPKIPEIAVEAIVAYIRYRWVMRDRKGLGEVQEARHSWLQERAAADGELNTPSRLEGKEIARSLNSMVQKVVVRDRQF